MVAIAEENTTWQKALAEKTITVATPPILIHVGDLPTRLFPPTLPLPAELSSSSVGGHAAPDFLTPLLSPPTVQVLSSVVLDRPFQFRVAFTNPLGEAISDGLLTVEGAGLVRGQAQIQ